MKYWLITDTHLSHKRLIDWGRPENFEDLIEQSLKIIKPEDTLIHLGDICIGEDKINNNVFTSLPCKKILVRGNHDNKSYSWYYEQGWDFVCETFRMRYKGKELLFSHFPVLEQDSKYTIHLPVHLNIHGHLHGMGKDSHRAISGYDKDGFNIDIAPDTHDYKLVNLDKVIDECNKCASI